MLDELIRGHVEKAIYEAQDLLIATHINDHNGKIDHLFPGKGKIRWNLVINAFKEIRYEVKIKTTLVSNMPLNSG